MAESCEPPTKRRRFFASEEDVNQNDVALLPTTNEAVNPKPPASSAPTRSPLAHDPGASNRSLPPANSESEAGASSLLPPPPRQQETAQSSSSSSSFAPVAAVAFDQATFEAVVGTAVEADVLRVVREASGDNLERAINMYMDGTWEQFKPAARAESAQPNGFSALGRAGKGKERSDVKQGLSGTPVVNGRKTPTGSRYIGSFGVEGWATTSGYNLLKHGDVVRIERQKILPPQKLPMSKGKATAAKAGASHPAPTTLAARTTVTSSIAASRRVDVLVRFSNTKGVELGRVSKDTANWISTLMDQKICRFEGECIYAPERLRTNETVFIQLRCYILDEAFFSRAFTRDGDGMNPPPQRFEQDETVEEKELRLRQVAVVRLLQEVNQVPTRGASTRDNRQDILQAAETDLAGKPAAAPTSTPSKDGGPDSPPSEQEDGQVLEQDQLDALYKKAQTFDFDTPEAEPTDSFAMSLRPYQKQSLHWMIAKEKKEDSASRDKSMHPLWEEYAWPVKDIDDRDLPESDHKFFYVNPYSGEMTLQFPVQEQDCLGGILADEMGLGKTIQMLSLVHTHKSQVGLAAMEAPKQSPSMSELSRILASGGAVDAPCTTLVVAPMSLLSQWQSEAEKASKEGTIKTMIYHGTEKNVHLPRMCCEASAHTAPDIIITSYGVVLSEFTQLTSKKGVPKQDHVGLFSLNFFRIILDEAHFIKNRSSKTAKACYELRALHRWVLTGTPVVNRLEDLFSLVRFLRVAPWSSFSYWKTFITLPFESKNFLRALDVVQTVLEPLVMRRTKAMRTPDGRPLVPLPPKRINIVEVALSQTEQDLYDYIFRRARASLSESVEAGTVFKSYTSIFAHVLRLRQACCHPVLVRNPDVVADEADAAAANSVLAGLDDDNDLAQLIDRFTAAVAEKEKDEADGIEGGAGLEESPVFANPAYGAEILRQIRDEATAECPVCAEEPMVAQTVTGCFHSACKQCLVDFIKHEVNNKKVPKCFNCREPISLQNLFEVVRLESDEEDDEGEGDGLLPNKDDDANTNGAAPPPDPTASFTSTTDLQSQHRGAVPNIRLQRLASATHTSSKVTALISHLRSLRASRPRAKAVVFSQFTSLLTLIEPQLTRAGIRFLRLDGAVAQKARAAVLDGFAQGKGFMVLLISLRAGGVGLNLTSASTVYMMDPWWSFAVESQAIDRVHRMGQEHEVDVHRFVVRGSVEERMLKIQEKKMFLATSLGMMSDEEKKHQRIEDIQDLLS